MINAQKGFTMPVVIAIVAVVLVLGGVTYYVNQSRVAKDKMEQEKVMMEKEAMEKKEKDVMIEKKDEGVMMGKEDGAMMTKYMGTVLAGKSAPLLDFTKADYDAAVKSDKLVVLYFYANWCPICKAEFPVMQKVFDELSTDKAIGFRVNYNDSDTDSNEKPLASQFGVAYQHTKVFLKNGQRILKSPETWDKNRYAQEINKALAQ